MKIEIWTDIICPWCGLGDNHLKIALENFAHAEEVEVIHRSFQLDERAPRERTRTTRDFLSSKGLTDAQIRQSTGRIEQMAKDQGLHPYIVLENCVGNTSMAHELATWATEQGKGAQMWDALFKAYFGEARSIFDIDSLIALAVDVGLDPSNAQEVLTSGRYRAAVLADGEEARRLGASGVPFIVLDRRYGIAGAQPAAVLLQAIDTAWRESKPRVVLNPVAEGDVCGPDGCAVPEGGKA